jgi:Na+-transporting NADH:ubiquinone oxidoreductase subunit F
MNTIVAAVILFTVVILLLSFMLIAARRRLVPQGEVKIVVNGDTKRIPFWCSRELACYPLCRIRISSCLPLAEGVVLAPCVNAILMLVAAMFYPTEMNHLTRREAAEGKRLACQVKVRQDMDIRIPEEIFGIKKWECEVVSNYNVASFIKEFVVRLPEGESMGFESGGYIQIDVPKVTVDYKDIDITAHPEHHGDDPNKFQSEWDKFQLWDLKMVNDEEQFRAYSMANHPAEGDIIMLNIRIATPPWDRAKNGWMNVNPGVCSSYVFDQKPGDKVTISGPYGEFFIKPTKKEMVYIGGGAGMAPLRSHLFHLFHTLKTSDRKVSFWYGGRTRRELFYIEQFREIEKQFPNFRFFVALDNPLPEDNWQVKEDMDAPGDGFQGYIMPVVYEQYLKNHPEPEEIEYYFCGPPMMNQSVINTLDELGVPEENIAFDDFGG